MTVRRFFVLFLVLPLLFGAAPSSASAGEESAPAAMEEQVHRRINAVRREKGLSSLEWSPALADVARRHSRRMARENFFGHADPSGRQVDDRLRAAGLSYGVLGENIFQSAGVPDPVEAAVRGWMKSPGHRANILRKGFTETGVGVWREGETTYITQIFRRPL